MTHGSPGQDNLPQEFAPHSRSDLVIGCRRPIHQRAADRTAHHCVQLPHLVEQRIQRGRIFQINPPNHLWAWGIGVPVTRTALIEAIDDPPPTVNGLGRPTPAGTVWAAVRQREEVRPMKAVSMWVLPLFVTVGD